MDTSHKITFKKAKQVRKKSEEVKKVDALVDGRIKRPL